jgi:hypothetical protein
MTHKNFAGYEDMIIHFADTKKTVKGTCDINDRFVESLREMLGERNVVVKIPNSEFRIPN